VGLTIHYKGDFKETAFLSEMISEVKEIAEVNKWKYAIFEKQFPDFRLESKADNKLLYGLCFTPPGCETVFLSFMSNGRMASPVHLKYLEEEDYQPEKEHLNWIFVKTQYAGVEVHKLIIHLFRYLEKKYFQNFIMIDEGSYWETGDEKLLNEIFKRYTDAIETFASALETVGRNTGESYDDYFLRIFKKLVRKKRKKE
jgi:hypothetical protein